MMLRRIHPLLSWVKDLSVSMFLLFFWIDHCQSRVTFLHVQHEASNTYTKSTDRDRWIADHTGSQ